MKPAVMTQIHFSSSPKHEIDRGGEAFPVLRLVRERAAPCRGQSVIARSAPILRDVPVARDETLMLEPLQRGIERTLIDVEHAARDFLNALADAPPVHWREREG